LVANNEMETPILGPAAKLECGPLKAKIALEAVREQATVADLAHRYKVMSRSALQRLPDQPPHEKGQRDRA
jgi:hypothetical protein